MCRQRLRRHVAPMLLSCPSNSAFLSKLFHSVTVCLSHDLHAMSLIQTHYHTTTFATTRSDTPCTSPCSSIKAAHFLIGFAVHHSQALQRGYACARHRQDIVLSAALRTASEPLPLTRISQNSLSNLLTDKRNCVRAAPIRRARQAICASRFSLPERARTCPSDTRFPCATSRA